MSSKFHLQDGDLSVLEQVDVLFKRNFSKVSTDILLPYYQEPRDARPAVLNEQIWAETIPTVAPTDLTGIDPETALDDFGSSLKGSTQGLTSSLNPAVRRYYKVPLVMIPGSNNLAYYGGEGTTFFSDVIYSNRDPGGTYKVRLFRQDETEIPNGRGEWITNNEYAAVTFFQYSADTINGVVTESDPPLISYYRYIGEKGAISQALVGALATKEFNDGDGTCGDLARAICIDTERGPLGTLLGDGDCSYAIQWGPDSSCGSWRIIVVGNGDGSTSLHFQYRGNTANVWQTKMHLDPAECDTTC